jgi:hypothetical protein
MKPRFGKKKADKCGHKSEQAKVKSLNDAWKMNDEHTVNSRLEDE